MLFICHNGDSGVKNRILLSDSFGDVQSIQVTYKYEYNTDRCREYKYVKIREVKVISSLIFIR